MIKGLTKKIILSMSILFVGALVSSQSIYGYGIVHRAVNKEDILGQGQVYYRKMVSAYTDTVRDYKKITTSDGEWVYSRGTINPISNTANTKDVTHGEAGSFERISEYFHPYINSNYIVSNQQTCSDVGDIGIGNCAVEFNSATLRYFAIRGSSISRNEIDDVAEIETMDSSVNGRGIYSIWGESGNYQGFYSAKQSLSISGINNDKIVAVDNNNYRYTIIDSSYYNGYYSGLYVSDNLLTNATSNAIYNKFKDTNIREDGSFVVYMSSALITAPFCGSYYYNMDTAYKAWRTLLNGKNAKAWLSSKSFPTASSAAAYSVINYYDNQLILPEDFNRETTVLVRHIDISNMSEVKPENITPDHIMNTNSGITMFHNPSTWDSLKSSLSRETTTPAGYSEKFIKKLSTDIMRVCNIKYNHETAGSYWNQLNDSNKEKYANYKCVAAIAGKADTLEKAEQRRDGILKDNNNIRGEEVGANPASSIVKNNDYTSMIVQGSEGDSIIVIDFYYEKQEKDVYVRHLDITDKSTISDNKLTNSGIYINTSSGEAFINSFDENYNVNGSTKVPRKTGSITPTGSTFVYQESYNVPIGSNLRICNIKYNHEIAGLYWNQLNYRDRENCKKYNCIGVSIGKGNTIAEAESNRNTAKYTDFAYSKETFKNRSIGYINRITIDQIISRNYDYTSVLLERDDRYKVVVIDFYYEEPVIPTEKLIYVRHVDVTGVNDSNISANKIDSLVNQGKVLGGLKKADELKRGTTRNINSLGAYGGYQERYVSTDISDVTVYKDNNVDYNCIGSNMVFDPDGSLETAKNKLDGKLGAYTNKYESSLKDSRTSYGSTADVFIIDFYYRSKYSGTLLNRDKVGRLAYYTAEDSNNFALSVNNYTSTNKSVTDAIPSNLSLKWTIDNAYTYMLGAINVVEKNIQDTHKVTYSISQKYNVTYNEWQSYCDSCGRTSSSKKTGTCGARLDCASYNTNEDGTQGSCAEYNYCTGNWNHESTEKTEGYTKTVYYEYILPYKYTYYKVKNMRLYTLEKAELYDGYSDSDKARGLSLFDGNMHNIVPSNAYLNSFLQDDAQFKPSNDTQSAANISKELTGTLSYDYDNDEDEWNISVRTTDKNYGANKVQEIFDDIDHSEAAIVQSLNTTGIADNSDSQTTKFDVNNDKILFKDGVINNATITIFGDSTKNTGTVADVGNNDTNKIKSYTSNEFNATKIINLSRYTVGKTRTGKGTSSSPYVYTVEDAEDLVDISTEKPILRNSNKTVDKYMDSSQKTKYFGGNNTEYFNLDSLKIPKERVNGKRFSYANVHYNIFPGKNNNLNFDVEDTSAKHSWTRTAVVGNGGKNFVDNRMYQTNMGDGDQTMVAPGSLGQIVWEYGKNGINSTDADEVNVFTPINFNTKVENMAVGTYVNHTSENVTNQIQKNARFTVSFEPQDYENYAGKSITTDSKRYISCYYIKFDFDVQNIKVDDAKGNVRTPDSGSMASKNTWVGPIYNEYGSHASNGKVFLSAVALADPLEASSVVNQQNNSYEVRSVSNNVPNFGESKRILIRDLVNNYPTVSDYIENSTSNVYKNVTSSLHYSNYYIQKIMSDGKHITKKVVTTSNISRVYDFKVTDLLDVDWKNIFRQTTSTNTNMHTGKAYYAGINKWNIYTATNYNLIEKRSTDEIGTTGQKTLPLGPYKNEISAYTYAPKLGYKFSFDLKTTGSETSKEVIIKPKFYYISKSGNNFKYDNEIKLFYKNSSNKYVDIGGYNLYFVPNDGYRLTFKGTDDAYRFSNQSISSKTVSLGNTKGITLRENMMEQADQYFVQIWYGEYKLPNSTIAVEVKDGKYNLNTPLTDGYIGVVFDIEVKVKNGDTTLYSISYNKNDGSTGADNTSQWDYEGYLGVKSGQVVSNMNPINIQLEKATWKIINNDIYNKIKGTVILYDTDSRASDDYQ